MSMAMWDSKSVRDVAAVDLRGGRLVRLELLAKGACLHVESLEVRYQGIFGDGYALFRQDGRLLVFDVDEASVSGALTGDDPIAAAAMIGEAGEELSWLEALQGAPATSLQLELVSGAAVSLRCSRATLGLEGAGTLLEGWIDTAPSLSPNGSLALVVDTGARQTAPSRSKAPTEPLRLSSGRAG